jgi:hemolysin activation/secretion protein
MKTFNSFSRRNYIYDLIIIALLLISFSSDSNAQTEAQVDRATREVDILNRPQELQRRLRKIPEAPPPIEVEKPERVEGQPEFFVKDIELTGTESFPAEKFENLIRPYENRNVSLSDLEKLASDIQKEYIKNNIIAAVFVPEQKIKDEKVTLQVVEAKMGDLIINQHPYFKDDRLKFYWSIKKGEVIRVDKLSKSIQLMNKNPDRQVSADLKAGKKPGTTDIILTAKTNRPAHIIANFDNEGAPSTGRSRTAVGFRHNNFLGLDDTLLAQYLVGRDYDGYYAFHSLPLNGNGASFVYGYSQSFAKPKASVEEFGLESFARTVSLSLHQDLFRGDKYLGEIFGGFDAKDKTVTLTTGTYSRERQRIFNLGTSLIFRELLSSTSLLGTLYQGVEAFGATPDDTEFSDRVADSTFTKFNLDINHRRILTSIFQLNLRLAGQVASTELSSQEQFSLGGVGSVRGYPAGDYLADHAVVQITEISVPAVIFPKDWYFLDRNEPLRDKITAYVFADNGWGFRRGDNPGVQNSVYFLGVGTGIRFKLFENSYLTTEWGFPLGDDTITEEGNSRFHFAVNIQF